MACAQNLTFRRSIIRSLPPPLRTVEREYTAVSKAYTTLDDPVKQALISLIVGLLRTSIRIVNIIILQYIHANLAYYPGFLFRFISW